MYKYLFFAALIILGIPLALTIFYIMTFMIALVDAIHDTFVSK